MLATPFTLPCGARLPNRLAKAAMTERITHADGLPHEGHLRLYDAWAQTKAGLLISGNIMIQHNHLESAGNVIGDGEHILPSLTQWTAAATQFGHPFWAQINHSGRQTNRFVNFRPKAPSAVQLKKMGLFGKPQAMTEADIEAVISGFIRTAKLCQQGGFTGVQIHSAHGYLLSQFLSPITNRRTDQWGGSLENRSRILGQIVQGIREAVGPQFPISVKLNSADFQRGGFTAEESLQVALMLNDLGLDLLELSGGTYENPAFWEMEEKAKPQKESTKRREAFFLDFAKKIRAACDIPLMVTGGFRSYAFCQQVLEQGEIDIVGMGRPFINQLPQIQRFLAGEVPYLSEPWVGAGVKQLADAAEGGYYARQLVRMSKGKPLDQRLGVWTNSLYLVQHEMMHGIGKRLAKRP